MVAVCVCVCMCEFRLAHARARVRACTFALDAQEIYRFIPPLSRPSRLRAG